ncbi:hypothetical protein [Chamaesiphon sp.]|uniref:hypothetical protein n=1 Tax=Chamaesiphon sp. TaxID=2814140 RepID=UPI003593C7CB
MVKKYLGLPLALITGLLSGSPSLANQPIVQNVYTPMNGVLMVNITPGVGVNLNFEGAGEYIQTMIADNRSFVGIKAEGCLAAQEGCQDPANLVHLTLIDKLQLPGVVKVNSIATQSVLTIRTRDRANNRRTYIFSLRQGSTKDIAIAQINFVKVAPPVRYYDPIAAKNAEELRQRENYIRLDILTSKLFNGLKIVVSRNEIPNYNKQGNNPIDRFILDVRGGMPLLTAATKHRIDLNLVSRLILLGS